MANNLKALRELRGWTQDHAAAAMNTTRNQYTKLESGKRRLSEIWIDRAANAFGVDAGEIVSERNDTVPIMGYVGAAYDIDPDFEQVPLEGLDNIEMPFAVPAGIIGFEVRGDSLRPVYTDGDVILVWAETKRRLESFYGEEAVVRTADGKRYLKVITYAGSRLTVTLQSFNSRPIENARLEWIGEIFAKIPASQLERNEERGAPLERARRPAA